MKQEVTPALPDVRRVAATCGLSTRQIFKLAREKKFPAPVRLNRSVRWRQTDIALFISVGCDMQRFETAMAGQARK
jgi:predicted DNA-binding transcriptional regulator AlpA